MSVVYRSIRRAGPVLAALALVSGLLGVGGAANAAPLTAPGNLAPAAASSFAETPTLSWDRVPDAAQYTVQVSAASDFSSLVWTGKTINKASVPPVVLTPGTVYWRVRGEAGTTLGPWSTSTFVRTSLEVPGNLAPVDGTLFPQPSKAATVSWSPVTGATGYEVQVSDDSAFATRTRSYTTKGQSVVVTNLLDGRPYYWRVRATYSTTIQSGWSTVRNFQLGTLAKPVRTAPGNGATVDSDLLDWEPVLGAVNYELQVSTSASFPLPLTISQKGLISTRFTPPTGLARGTYYWRVRPFDYLSNSLAWSAVDTWSFTRGFSAQPDLEVPAYDATVGDPMHYQWTPARRADSYTLQLSTNAGFSSIFDTCTTLHTSYVPTGPGDCMPNANGTYYWRVLGTDGPTPLAGSSPVTSAGTAEVGKFVYRTTRPILTAPASGAWVDVPTLKWAPVTGATQYRVTITSLSGLGTTTQLTTGTSFTPRTPLVVNEAYRWQVQAVGRSGQVGSGYSSGEQPTFSVAAPAPAVATSPDPWVVSQTATRFPTLTWSPVVDAASYVVRVRPAGTSTWVPLADTFTYSAGEDDTTTWLAPGTYQWRVSAYDDESTLLSSSSYLAEFTISALGAVTGEKVAHTAAAAGALATACGRSLANVCSDLRQTPVLSWNADSDATYYRVFLARDEALTNPIAGYPKILETTRHMPSTALADNTGSGRYYWAVQACRTATTCTAASAATHAFTKVSKPVELLSPAAGEVVTAHEITLSWRDYSQTTQDPAAFPIVDSTGLQTVSPRVEAREYRLQVAKDSGFSTIYDDLVVNQTDYTTPLTTYEPGTVYWRVRAIDGGGNNLPWSATQSFTKRTPLMTLVSPVDGESVAGAAPLIWESEPYAVTYDVEVYQNAANPVRVWVAHSKVPAVSPAAPLAVSSDPYVWRVRPIDAKGRVGRWTSLTAPAAQFMVVGDAPSLVTPAGGEYVEFNEGLFTWTAVQGAAKYRFERRAKGTTSVVQRVSTLATSFAPPAKIGTGTWEWRAVTLDTAGKLLGASPWRTFKVDVTGPKVKTNTPTGVVSRTTNFKATFDEEVTNVSTSTFTITASGASGPLAANVSLDATGTVATLNPSASLIAGKKYVVRVTSGITDLRGNPATAMSWTVTAK